MINSRGETQKKRTQNANAHTLAQHLSAIAVPPEINQFHISSNSIYRHASNQIIIIFDSRSPFAEK